ncbi:MAG: hypothetical protein V7K25_16495 [Nostoc sp.]|uniref:hypothetical protein n=1 Tax=Nostoc sp. TaxID=1180 RepID=UPI002FF56228
MNLAIVYPNRLFAPVFSINCQTVFRLRSPPAGGYAIAINKALKGLEVALKCLLQTIQKFVVFA